MKKTHIYLLSEYANPEHLKNTRYPREYELQVKYEEDGLAIELTETNSLVEEKYSLNLKSSRFIVDGSVVETESKESMIHHHPQGHPWKHLQFRLSTEHKVIRINLEPLDQDDYERCIKGFLHISKDLIEQEHEGIKDYFFNDNINKLDYERKYLLGKIKSAFTSGNLLDDSNNPIDALDDLKKEQQLLPFLDW